MATLGSRLKRSRERKNMTQMEVAELLGISNGTLSGYERDYRDPDTDTLQRLADLYDVRVDWLLKGGEYSSEGKSKVVSDTRKEVIDLIANASEDDFVFIKEFIKRVTKAEK